MIMPRDEDSQRSKRPNRSAAAAQLLAERKKNQTAVGATLLHMSEKIGVVEQTRLAPEFQTALEHYEDYQKMMVRTIQRLETILQPNSTILETGAIESEERSDPYEVAAQTIKMTRHMMPEKEQTAMAAVEAMFKRMAILNRECQLKGRRAIRKSRRFVAAEYNTMKENEKNMMEHRDMMDTARHELKGTRTALEVEEKGQVYEEAVRQFDEQAGIIWNDCERLVADKANHQRELLDWFEVRARHHQQVVLMIEQNLKRLGISTKQH
ncbi:hypothetical protein M3Y94_01174700 [Aphelenchoides besseyi]|nr:hypothetical protein M3Y94_01174700 [Aphelenchoides besseyi]KAI6228187.1 BAR domain-containing protein [Aphelenchoides besseyi]